ncbi:unnamed protein product [Mytilus edulis]|uniref:CCHC-type domain-containing protein n=1 Tax=Mytilus edulis TaxID=6550 RepID=A0A8S3QT26_MYTED|nr:unnamed protein product [Mytilus edulis]
MDKLRAPDKFNVEARNLADAWKRWKEEVELYIDLTMVSEDEKAKVKMFLYLVLQAFENHCNPKKNETVERYMFNMRNQRPYETFDKYITELKLLASTCNYGAINDSLVRDRIVCGISNSSLRERLLRTLDLTLDKTMQLGRAAELTNERIKTLENPTAASNTEVNAVRNKTKPNTKFKQKQSTYVKHDKQQYRNNNNCKYCGRKHEHSRSSCPAYGQTCRKCGKTNHFESVCQSGKIKTRKPHQVRTLSDDHASEDYDSDEFFEIKAVTLVPINTVDGKNSRHVYATMNIVGNKIMPVRFQLDSGATCNIMNSNALKELGIKELKKTSQVVKMYNKTTIKPLGICQLKLINPKNDAKFKAEFIVVKDKTLTPLLGNKTVQAMNLMTIHYENIKSVQQGAPMSPDAYTCKPIDKADVLKEYEDVFEGTGFLEGKYHLELNEHAQPVVHPPRKVPVAIKDQLQTELNRLCDMNIITQVTKPTSWVSSLLTVVKPNKLRVCIDPNHLNQHIKRSHYPLQTIDCLLPELSNTKIFSVVDAKIGFWHVQLDEESSYLTTFNTPFGRYRWLRMPFGITSAPEEYQRRQDQAVEGIPRVKSIIDDILIYGEGKTKEEAIKDHDRKFRLLMERCRERNLKLNKDKLKLKMKEVKVIGQLITNKGLKMDPEKVRAVLEMPKPTDVSGVRRLVGFVTYLSKFLPKLSHICEPLRKLTLTDSGFCWLENHDKALTEINTQVTSEPVLKYYDPNMELTLQSDASETGLGAAILQENQPIAYASRALTDTETRYAQIEKELLSVVFGLQKFHQYTYGRNVYVTSDHKPLESILKKPLHYAPKRLQRMMLQLQKYNIELVCKPGK